MKMKALVAVKTKLFKPCRKALQIFKFKLRKPFSIRALRLRSWHNKHRTRESPPKNRMAAFLSGFRPLKKSKQRNNYTHSHSHKSLAEIRSFNYSEATTTGLDNEKAKLFPSPLTPAYVKLASHDHDQDVEDACRGFENYLVEMIVEEGKVGDLTDVEELLYCWKNLKSPVFIDLVCRFYGELCKDLFSPEDEYVDDSPN